MLFIWHYLLSALCLTYFIQRYYCFCYFLFNVAIVLVIFAWCSLLDVAIPFVALCLMLLHFLLLLVWCCCSSYYSLFNATTPFVVLCLTLLFFVICLTLRILWSFVFNVVYSNSFLLCRVVALLFFVFIARCCYSHSSYFGLISLLVFCRCGRSYPNSSF